MNEYGVAEYDYTLIRLPCEQGWSLRLLKGSAWKTEIFLR